MHVAYRLVPLLLLLLFLASPAAAQDDQWTVSTIVGTAQGLEDGIVMDHDGNLYISEYNGETVYKVTPGGTVSVFADGFTNPNGLAFDDEGNLYVPSAQDGRISKVTPTGLVDQNFITGLTNPSGVTFNATYDTMYVAHYEISRISKVPMNDRTNIITWLTGSPLDGPVGFTWDDNGVLYTGNFNDGTLVRLDADGTMTAIETVPPFMGFVAYANGKVYTTSFSTHRIYEIDPATGTSIIIAGATRSGQVDGVGADARFNGPNGIVASVTGDTLYVSEFNTQTLRMLVRTSTSTSVEGEQPDADGFALTSAYPNPFRTTTTITYDLAQPTSVTVEVYNLLGQRVWHRSRGLEAPGPQRFTWRGESDLGLSIPNGVYFVSVRTPDETQTIQVVLQR